MKIHDKDLIVPRQIVIKLQTLGAELVYLNDTVTTQLPSALWKYLVMSDPDVHRVLLRRSDVYLTERDLVLVNDWLKNSNAVLCVRDLPEHRNASLVAGLIGLNLKPFSQQVSISHLLHNETSKFVSMSDQQFLDTYIWPSVRNETTCYDSVNNVSDKSKPFPDATKNMTERIGVVYNENIEVVKTI
jgi:hypothetical protein